MTALVAQTIRTALANGPLTVEEIVHRGHGFSKTQITRTIEQLKMRGEVESMDIFPRPKGNVKRYKLVDRVKKQHAPKPVVREYIELRSPVQRPSVHIPEGFTVRSMHDGLLGEDT